ncbi:MAG TPA: glycosyltransferase [Firmicutes bacterium]|nr:glycosyltransferase [Bacillota bacterium]
MENVDYSLIIPVYNEEETLSELYKQVSSLIEKLDGEAEVILVDDGSKDRSYSLMIDIHNIDPRFKIIRFSKNFGHQIAITAGMDFAGGKAIIIMDADLQDPPEVVLEMAACWREGYDIVYAQRAERQGETFFKKLTAAIFYRLLHKLTQIDIPVDVGDFRLVDYKALEAFKVLREHNRYVRGMFSWIGFKQIGITYQRSARFAGRTKYPFKKMLKLALDGIFSFSNIPLQLVLKLGMTIIVVSLLGFIILAILALDRRVISGLIWLYFFIALTCGLQLFGMGLIGEYVGRIYEEAKNRPLYIIKTLHGLETDKIFMPHYNYQSKHDTTAAG